MEAHKICLKHNKELLPLYCKDCEDTLCSQCIEIGHCRHNIVDISSVAEEHRRHLKQHLSDPHFKNQLLTVQDVNKQKTANLINETESIRQAIHNHVGTRIEEIKRLKHTLLEKVESEKEKRIINFLHEDSCIKELQRVLNHSTLDDDREIVILSLFLRKTFQMICIEEHERQITFLTNSTPLLLGDVIGSVVHEHDVTSDFEITKDVGIVSNSTQSNDDDNETFHDCEGVPMFLAVCEDFGKQISHVIHRAKSRTLVLSCGVLFEVRGDESSTQSIQKSQVQQVINFRDGSIYILMAKGQDRKIIYSVQKLLPNDTIVPVCEIGKHDKVCLGQTLSNDILVCSFDDYGYKKPFVRITVLDSNGAYIQSCKLQEDLSEQMYMYQYYGLSRIIGLQNQTVVVSYTYVLNTYKNLKLSSSYEGILFRSNNAGFTVRDMCLDPYGNVLVAVENDNAIHLLDNEGKVLGLLLTASDGISRPLSVSFDSHQSLWVGCKDGKVYTADYSTIFHSSVCVNQWKKNT